MGACLSKKKGSSSTTTPVAPVQIPSQLKCSGNNGGVTVTLSKPTNPEVNLRKEKKTVQEKQQQEPVAPVQEGENQVKKEIFIIKHRKSHDDNRERSSKIQPCTAQQNVPTQSNDGSSSESAESLGNNNNNKKVAPCTPNIGVGVRTSSCTKEEVDAILIQCGRLSRSSSGRAASSSAAGGRKYSGSKRSFDFDHCDNDANSNDDDQRRVTDNSDLREEYDGAAGENRRHQHRQRHRQSPRPSPRRRTPSRERDQQQSQRSSSRERRVSRSPGRRSSETNSNGANANGSNNGNNTGSSRPGKMVSVPATVTLLVMDKSNNNGGVGGGESAAAAATGVKRITVKRNVGDCGVVGSRGAASPRSQSPARAQSPARGNAKTLGDNQQQPSLSRNNSSRKAEQSPYRRNPLSEIDPNSLSYPQSNANNGSSKVQNRPKKETEAEANQKPYALEKGVSANYKTKEQQEEETEALASMNNDNVVVKTVVPTGAVENLKPQTLTRSRSSRRSRDLDLNPEALLNPAPQSYTSLLLEDIQNFHQKNTTQPSISLPACLSKACSILEAVADLNSTTSSNFSGAFSEDKKSPQTDRNEHNVSSLGANNHYGKKRVADTTTRDHPFVESEVLVSDDVMEPSLHKYVTVKRGGSVCGLVDMEDQESSGSNSFTVSSGQQNHWGISSSSWEPNSADSTDCWTSRLMEGSDAVAEARKALNCKRRGECDDHQHSSGIGRGRLGSSSSKGLHHHHNLPVVTATAAST